ncbi:SMR family transporter [Chachezhania antarctica]|uniref:SMR family transporter n=1 Tax=Chachezhania antarctica TaxID=2340860 RepID=UPI000EB3DB8B|nr:SMR family transporter [Chachezhania antarctica]|tara:strand:- start:2193 stop:2522 length:330 start_codon:yes stop_codon:yes gene_type:complete
MHYVFLGLAIIGEVIGTTALQASNQMTKLVPAIIVVVAYTASFYTMALAFRVIPVGVAYAIWSGAGIVLIAGIAWALFGQKLDLPAVLGMILIVAGIMVINLFSNSGHA